MSISVVIPAYNEGQVIAETIDKVHKFLASNYEKYQIVAVNDGSSDDTLRRIYSAPTSTVVSYGKNMGKGYALRKGVEKAWGDIIVLYDADMAYSLYYIKKAEKLLRYFDIVAGTRINSSREASSMLRNTVSKGFAGYVDKTFHLSVSDTQCGFKVFRNTAAKKLFPLTTLNGFAFDVEIFVLAEKYRYSIAELPVNPEPEVRPSRVNILCDAVSMAGDVRKIKRRARKM